LLLVLGTLLKITIPEDLKVDQTRADRKTPEEESCTKKVEPNLREIAGRVRRHVGNLRQTWRPVWTAS